MDSYYDSNTRCPRSSKNVDNNNQTLIRLHIDYFEQPLSDMAPKATPSIYNSAHAHTNICRQKIDSAAIVDFFHLRNCRGVVVELRSFTQTR